MAKPQVLDALHNLLTSLPASLSELRELHLQNNRLEDLAADNWDALQKKRLKTPLTL